MSYGCMAYGQGYLFAYAIVFLFSKKEFDIAYEIATYAFSFFSENDKRGLLEETITWIELDLDNVVESTAGDMLIYFAKTLESPENRSIVIAKLIELI